MEGSPAPPPSPGGGEKLGNSVASHSTRWLAIRSSRPSSAAAPITPPQSRPTPPRITITMSVPECVQCSTFGLTYLPSLPPHPPATPPPPPPMTTHPTFCPH